MLADWPIFMPSTAAQLTDYFEAGPTAGRLVVWLNETQKFLGPDGLTAATIRHILARPRPVIIVGTIWPRHYDTFAGATATTLGDGGQDGREILVMLAQRKDLPSEFNAAEYGRADSLAARDRRIAEATETASSCLAETLAAAPDLISRWLTAAAGRPEIDLHDVRHSYATAGRAAKIDWKALSQRIGHADVAFTMKQYVQTDLEADRQVANTLATLIIGGSLATTEVTGEADKDTMDDPGGDEGAAA